MKAFRFSYTLAVLIIALVAMVGWAAEPPHYARADRYSELTTIHGDTLLGTADTTAAAKISQHSCAAWAKQFVSETWIDSSTAFDTDTVFFDWRYKQFSGGSWSAWTRVDTATAHQVRRYKQVTMPALKPWAIEQRATQKSNSASTLSTPHWRWWAQ